MTFLFLLHGDRNHQPRAPQVPRGAAVPAQAVGAQQRAQVRHRHDSGVLARRPGVAARLQDYQTQLETASEGNVSRYCHIAYIIVIPRALLLNSYSWQRVKYLVSSKP